MHFAEGFVAGAVAAGAAVFIYHRSVLHKVKTLIQSSEFHGKALEMSVKMRLERWLGALESTVQKLV